MKLCKMCKEQGKVKEVTEFKLETNTIVSTKKTLTRFLECWIQCRISIDTDLRIDGILFADLKSSFYVKPYYKYDKYFNI